MALSFAWDDLEGIAYRDATSAFVDSTMLRILYTCCDLMAAVFALLSPLTIFHWLLRIINSRPLTPYLAPLTDVFQPLNTTLEALLRLPILQFKGQQIPTTQGVLACLFTVAFFSLSVFSEYLKTTEQRMDLDRQASLQRNRLKRLQELQSHRHQRTVLNRRYLAQIEYDFNRCPAGGQLIQQRLAALSGNVLERRPDAAIVEFTNLTQALNSGMQISQSLLHYYGMLRPKDPQPPFRVGVHALDASLSTVEALHEVQRLVAFAPTNSVIFSESVRDVLEADGQSLVYHFQSLGLYGIGSQQQELFKLFNTKPGR